MKKVLTAVVLLAMGAWSLAAQTPAQAEPELRRIHAEHDDTGVPETRVDLNLEARAFDPRRAGLPPKLRHTQQARGRTRAWRRGSGSQQRQRDEGRPYH